MYSCVSKYKDNDRCFIIAEAGVNHNGDVNLALKLCDAAKRSGADAVKFQTWVTENLITQSVNQADYQKNNTGKEISQFEMLKPLELTYEEFRRVKMYCDEIGIMFCSTADDIDSLNFLVELGIPFIKVASGDIANVPFLRYMGSKGLPVILSTGMSTLADVDLSIRALQEGGATDITVLHCTTNYPCPYNEVNLHSMETLNAAFHLPVGYSDHTLGTEISVAAVAMGAQVIEKHFTLDKTMEGPDHAASTEPEEFKRMVDMIRHVEEGMGDGIKRPSKSEKSISTVVTKRIVAKRIIHAGEKFTDANICFKRNDSGELAREWDRIIGRIAKENYEVDQGIII